MQQHLRRSTWVSKLIWFWQREMACPCSSHLFCLQLCSDIVNGLILAVFIAVVKASFFDNSVIQLKSKLTVTWSRSLRRETLCEWSLESRVYFWAVLYFVYSKLFPLFSYFIRKLSCVCRVLISSGCQVAICCAGAVLVDLLWEIFSHKDTEQALHFCRVYIK